MKAKRYIPALGAFFVLAASLLVAGCGSGVPGDAVANVAGNPITTQAFDHWMFVAAKSQAAQNPGQPVIVPNDPPDFAQCIANVRKQIPRLGTTPVATLRADCKSLFTSLNGQVMDFLVKAYWYQAEAARAHITVSDAQVLKAFNTAKNQQFSTPAQYQAFLSQTGQTPQDIIFRFRVNQIYTKLLAKQNTKVSAGDIAAYYNSHRSQFGTPETRDMHIVLTKTAADAGAAKAALQHGQSWAAVAKKYSTDASTKNNGGLLQGVAKGQQDAALDNAAFSATVNTLIGPIKGQFGYYVLEVAKIHPPTQQSLTQASATIRSTLTSQKQTSAQTVIDNTAKSHWLKQTVCRSGYAMADCSNYTAPAKTPSTTSTG